MNRPSLLRWSTAMALVGALALAGCADGAKPATEPTSAAEESPLTKLINGGWGPEEQDNFNRQQDEVENKVADCMAAEGFTYVPMKSHSTETFTDDDMEDRNAKEWAAKNGYGMFVEEVPEESGPEGEPTEEWVDPNAAYMNSLSETEMAAFEAALWGNMWELTEEEMMDENYVYSWEDSGCQGAAQHEVFDTQGPEDEPRFAELMDSMGELYASVQTAPETVAAAAKWSDCMADAGYTGFTTVYDASQSVMDAGAALYDQEEGSDAEYTSPSDEAIAQLGELEIATAVADFDCREKVDWEAVNREVTLRLEEAFVKDNKVALDEYVAALESARG